MADLVIRDYDPKDIERILTVIKRSFAEQKGLVDPPSSAERKTIEIVEDELKRANALVFESEGSVVGCVFYQSKNDSIYFDRLAVLPEFRRNGIGTSLINEVERRAVEMHFGALAISVRIELRHQQNYYQNLGFRITSHESHQGYTKPTYVKMKKILEAT